MKKHFITGMVILLPLAVTVMITAFFVNLLTTPFIDLFKTILQSYNIRFKQILFLSADQVFHYGSQIIILLCLFLVTALVGMLTRWFVVNRMINLGDYLLHHIPFVNSLYKTSQDITKTLFREDSDSFQQVVMVPFPNKEVFSIGLITKEAPPNCEELSGSEMVSVFVPTTPNPTSGYLLMFKKQDIFYIDMKVEDAVKFIISCGMIYPGNKKKTIAHQSTKSPD